jgi:hypothetical protein
MAGRNMRQIKFRVWDNLKKEWCSNQQIWRIRNDVGGVGQILPPAIYWKQHPQGLTIQQFIGIQDKHGVDIYEGDLVNFEVRGIIHGPEREFMKRAEVWYSDEDLQFVFGKYQNLKYTYWYSMLDDIDKSTIEVVGHIFQ